MSQTLCLSFTCFSKTVSKTYSKCDWYDSYHTSVTSMKHLEVSKQNFDSFLSSCDFHISVEDLSLLGCDGVLLSK
jgi:hypothetical protein